MRILLTSKRTCFALVVLGVMSAALVARLVTGEQFIEVVKLLVGAVVVGHTVSHAVDGGAFKRAPNVAQAIVVEKESS